MRNDALSRGTRRLVRGVLLGAALSALAGGAASAAASPRAAAPAPAFVVPMTGSLTAGGTTWSTVVMGKDDGDFDLFWELFTYDASSARFVLSTPPGVADNGGLLLAPTGSRASALVGFGASQDLRFSPLASTLDAGGTWSQGGLPDALVNSPSALAASATTALALIGTSDERVVVRAGGLTSWRTLTTAASLADAMATSRCSVSRISAVAIDPSRRPLLGATCRRPGTPGLFVASAGGWRLQAVHVPTALSSDTFQTLRLGATSALFGERGASSGIIASWASEPGQPWSASPVLPVGSASALVATGAGPGTTQFVVVRTDGQTRAEVIAGPSARWVELPALPPRTATLAIAPDRTAYALSVDVDKLSVWRLQGGRWRGSQTIKVTLPYGTSS